MRRISIITILACLCCILCGARGTDDVRLLYWNIQNGMWSDQGNNYDNFVEFVRSQDPDICVWCEAESRYRTGTADRMAGCEEAYLPYNWDLLARRYGHNYWCLAGKRDTFPQVITSKYPLHVVKRVTGDADDVLVSHGAGWVQVEIDGKTINLVTLHTWPQGYAYLAEDRQASRAEHGGDFYRRREMERICAETILTSSDVKKEYWMMMGDFNSRSRLDAAAYPDLAADSPAYLVHDYVLKKTPYVDVLSRWSDNKFYPTTGSGKRIDFVYANSLMYYCVRDIRVLSEGWPAPVRDTSGLSNFYHPSDHKPILVDFNVKGAVQAPLKALDIKWNDLERGAQWGVFEGELFGSRQHIAVLRYPAKKFETELVNDSGLLQPKRPEYPGAVDPSKPATTTSGFGERYGAFAALNAGYFNMKTLYPKTFVLDDGVVEGGTTPDELPRVDGMIVFNGKHKMDIFSCDTLSYEQKSKGWKDAIACGPVLIEEGVVKGDWPETTFYYGRHPRTIIGTTKDGYVYFVDIDGRWHYRAEGATIPETAEVARLLGLHEALNLDGGGSSTLWTRPTGVISHPNDNDTWDHAGERVIPNAIIVR